MKTSELITLLNRSLIEDGDLMVVVPDHIWGGAEVASLRVEKDRRIDGEPQPQAVVYLRGEG